MREARRSTCGEVAPPVGQRLRSAFLLLVVASSLLPGCSTSRAELDRSMDDALLLALASHEQLERGQPTAARGGHGLLMAPRPAAAAGPKNPHWEMASWYEDMAMQLDEEKGPMFDYAAEKIEEHNRLAGELDKARQQRAGRGRGFQRVLRGVARIPLGVGRAVGVGVRETIRFAKTVILVAADQVPQLARDYIQRKLRTIGALIQGRIDLVWDKIADQVGWPFATWLRLRVDKAFIRRRDRLLRRSAAAQAQPHGPANAATQTAAAQVGARAEAFEQAGSMVASCTYYELADPARPDGKMAAIPFEIRMDMETESLAYRIEVEEYYEDYQKCDVSAEVEGGGVFADSDEAWFQGEETMTSVTSCYILNIETGERYGAAPRQNTWKREIAGFVDESLTNLYWCPAVQLGGINTMMQTGRAGVIASGICQVCPIGAPR